MSRNWSKRAFDLSLAAMGLLFLLPVFVILAVLVKCCDGGPIFFRQKRTGQFGKPFSIVKFRSMVVNAENLGNRVTTGGDRRITAIGRFLRRWKLDELPQLWNVLRGEMSFVGPRPEVPYYVEKYTDVQKPVLTLKPGITDLATLEFRNEEELLRLASDVEKTYVEYCLPRKIELSLAYAQRASLWEDIKIVMRTLLLWMPWKSQVELKPKSVSLLVAPEPIVPTDNQNPMQECEVSVQPEAESSPSRGGTPL